MKNVLIFLSILIVVMLAVIDVKARIRELDAIAGKTPAQVEMKDDILAPSKNNVSKQIGVESKEVTTQDNLFNSRLKEQQSNNILQQKQHNTLDIKK